MFKETRSNISSYLLDLSCLFSQLNFRFILLIKCQIGKLKKRGEGQDEIKCAKKKGAGKEGTKSGRPALSLLLNPSYVNMNKMNLERR